MINSLILIGSQGKPPILVSSALIAGEKRALSKQLRAQTEGTVLVIGQGTRFGIWFGDSAVFMDLATRRCKSC
jgi:hypothetical protein